MGLCGRGDLLPPESEPPPRIRSPRPQRPVRHAVGLRPPPRQKFLKKLCASSSTRLSLLVHQRIPAIQSSLLAAAAASLCLIRPVRADTGDERWTPAAPPGPAEDVAIGAPEMESYFAKGPAKAARAAFDAGKAREALALLPAAPRDPQTRYLRAAALLAAGESAAGAKAFAALAPDYPLLADRCHFTAARAASESADYVFAAAQAALVSEHSVESGEAVLLRAHAFLSSGDPAGALVALASFLTGRVRGDMGAAFLAAGDAQLALGHAEAARAAFRSAWLEHPLSPAAGPARLRDLALPGFTAPEVGSEIRRAEALLEAYRTTEALAILDRLKLPLLSSGHRCGAALFSLEACKCGACAEGAVPLDLLRPPATPSDPLMCRAHFARGKGLRQERHNGRALEALAPVWEHCADYDLRSRALFLGTQAAVALGEQRGASAGSLSRALADGFVTSSLADDALLALANLARRAGDARAEEARLTELVLRFPSGDVRAEALFRLFWNAYAQGETARGIVFLDQLEREYGNVGDGVDGERARYWKAVARLGIAGAEARAIATRELSRLSLRRPMSYYGLLARTRLAALDPARAKEIGRALAGRPEPPSSLREGPLAGDTHLAAGLELLRLGFRTEAQREFAAVDKQPARDGGRRGREALVLLARLSSMAGDVRGAHLLVRTELRKYLRRAAGPFSRAAAEVAYPLAFRDPIERFTRTAKVPPDLLQALMREESALDPLARSSTGALGLTQLMPFTARAVARALRLPPPTTASLEDPEVNIRLGAAYLGQLLKSLKSPPLAVAAYNCGPGCVARWLATERNRPPVLRTVDAFVEEIPVEETRQYVKRVLRSYATYAFLYGKRGALEAPWLILGL